MTKKEKPSAPVLLLVDDDETMRKALAMLFRSEGYQVIEAGDGNTAKNITENSTTIDLIVTDLCLKDMTGLEIYARFGTKIPVLILTGFSDSLLGEKARCLAGDNFLEKSENPDLLLRRITELLEQRTTCGKSC